MIFCQMAFGLSFYGVMAILTRFFLENLEYSEAKTMMVVGAFSAIGPLFAIAGGFIADKFLGAYRSLTIAFFSFAVGYALLVFGASISNVAMSLAGIALASYARGLMSPSYPSLFKRTFKTQEDFEKGYPVNYSVNNVGTLLGQYLFPFLVASIAFTGGFLLSCVMATLAFLALYMSKKFFISVAAEIDHKPVGIKNWTLFGTTSVLMIGLVFFMFSNMDIGQNIVYAIGVGAILYFIYQMFVANSEDRKNMGAILIIVGLSAAFFVYYGQMMTSMTIVSINTMRGDLFGIIPIAPEASMAMNPLWCMVAGPVIAFIFSTLEKKNIHLSTATKVAYAFAGSFLIKKMVTKKIAS